MNTYFCQTYKGNIQVQAETTFEAQKKAIAQLRIPEKKRFTVSVYLMGKPDHEVVLVPQQID